MKRVVLALLAVLLLAPSLAWGDDSRHYEFRLAANGEATYHAAAGDTVTVSLSLCRTTGTGPMFAMQDEICFDPAFFAYQPDGTLLREGVKTTLVTLRDGRQAVYMNCVDFGGGADWADETIVGSFQLKVLADGGASAITGSHYLVSTEDGMGRYAAAARDVTVVVSEQCRVTFQSNGGSGVALAEVLRGTPLTPPQAPTRSGYRFTGWYSDYDLTRPWDFNAPVTADMTLYAAWQPLPPVAEESTAWKPKKLPWWRRTIAAVCGAGALAIFWLAAKHTDLTALVGGGTLSQAGWQALGLYGLFIALLFGCIAAIGRRSKPLTLLQTPVQKRKLSHRTRLAAALILLCIPATLYLGFFYLGNTAYYPIAFAVLLECMVPFFLVFEGRKPQARELVLVASLCALGVAGRAAFFMLPQFKPVLALTIISGVALGGETGFLVGAMTMLASNVLFSQGPWTPFQMFAMGIIGFLAGVLFRRGWLRRSRAALCVFGAISAVLIYGGIMNPVSALLYSQDLSWQVLVSYYLTGFPMDCVHAAATVFFLWVLAEPMLEKLDRIKIKYGLVE